MSVVVRRYDEVYIGQHTTAYNSIQHAAGREDKLSSSSFY
jgi:hypothetical protein